MKKIIAVCLVIISLLAASSSAEMLFTAQPIGQSKWTGVIGYVNNVNVSNNPNLTGPTSYAHIGYGLNNKTDLYLQGGVCYVQGLPTPITLIGSDIGLTFKYQLLDEKYTPVSVAIYATARLTRYVGGSGLTTDLSGNTNKIGIVIDKVLSPFIPYTSLAYQLSSLSGNTDVIWDPTIGFSLAWSKQGTFFVEDTYQMYHSHTGSDYNSNQYAFGVGYTL